MASIAPSRPPRASSRFSNWCLGSKMWSRFCWRSASSNVLANGSSGEMFRISASADESISARVGAGATRGIDSLGGGTCSGSGRSGSAGIGGASSGMPGSGTSVGRPSGARPLSGSGSDGSSGVAGRGSGESGSGSPRSGLGVEGSSPGRLGISSAGGSPNGGFSFGRSPGARSGAGWSPGARFSFGGSPGPVFCPGGSLGESGRVFCCSRHLSRSCRSCSRRFSIASSPRRRRSGSSKSFSRFSSSSSSFSSRSYHHLRPSSVRTIGACGPESFNRSSSRSNCSRRSSASARSSRFGVELRQVKGSERRPSSPPRILASGKVSTLPGSWNAGSISGVLGATSG